MNRPISQHGFLNALFTSGNDRGKQLTDSESVQDSVVESFGMNAEYVQIKMWIFKGFLIQVLYIKSESIISKLLYIYGHEN